MTAVSWPVTVNFFIISRVGHRKLYSATLATAVLEKKKLFYVSRMELKSLKNEV